MTSAAGLDPWLREILRCPACRSTLVDAEATGGGTELVCAAQGPDGCGRAYRIDDGVPVLLVDEGRLPAAG